MTIRGEVDLESLIPINGDLDPRADNLNLESMSDSDSRSRFSLKSIRMENFKSYSGTIEVSGFPKRGEDSLICVVGPNGAGKSNLMDAIAFCFNCADSSKLRGEGMLSNLISSGLSPSENSSAVVAVTLVDSNDKTIVFARSVNSRNESRYKVNNKNVTLEKYREKMTESGLDTRGNFLVFQGDVESLALSTPSELGAAIDRVSGSSQYKAQYDLLKQKKQDQEQILTTLMSRRRTLTNDRKRFSSEIAELEKLKSLKSEVNSLRTQKALVELYGIQRESARLSDESTESEPMEIDSNALSQDLDKRKAERAETDLAKSKAERSLVRARQTFSETSSTLSEKQNRLDSMKSKSNRVLKEISSNKTNQEVIQGQISRVTEQIGIEDSNLRTASEDLENWITRKAAGDPDFESDTRSVVPALSSLLGKDVQYSEYLKPLLDTFRKYQLPLLMASEREKFGQFDIDQADLISTLERLVDKESELTAQLQRNVANEKSAVSKRDEFEESVLAKTSELKSIEKELDKTKSRLVRFESKLDELMERKQTYIDSLSVAKETEEQIAKERSMLELLSELEMKFGGRKIFGRIVDLITPTDPKWSTAIEVAAGKYLDAILVSDTVVAKECHGYIKTLPADRKIPSLTFIPVTDVAVPAPVVIAECERVFDIVNVKPVSVTLTESDSEFAQMCIQRGLEFVFNDCAISESLKEGRTIAFNRSVKVVTRNGEKISGKNGTITIGGSLGGCMGKRFDVKQVTEITKKLDVLESQISAARGDISTLQNEVEKFGREIRRVEIAVNDATRNRDIWKNEASRISVQIDALAKSLAELKGEKEDVSRQQVELGEARNRSVEEVVIAMKQHVLAWMKSTWNTSCEDDTVLMNIAGVDNDPRKNLNNQFEETRASKRKRVNEVESRLESLKNERRFLVEQSDLISSAIKDLENEKKDVDASIKKGEKEVKKLTDERDDIQTGIEKLETEIKSLLQVRSEKDAEIRRLIEEIGKVSVETRRPNRDTRAADLRSLFNRAIQVLKQSVVDNVLIPLTLDDNELVAPGGATSTVEQMSRNIVEALYAATDSTNSGEEQSVEELTKEVIGKIDYAKLESNLKRQIDRINRGDIMGKILGMKTELESQIREKITGIERMNIHSSNVNGAEVCATIDVQLEALGREIDGVKSELTLIETELKKIRQIRNELFMKCFDYVALKVGELYRVLTSYDQGEDESGHQEVSAIVPVSSSTAVASLDLEMAHAHLDTAEIFESGIIFSLMPPFKRYTKIELLSGGEKTVAAVALLFSMLSFSSPPFAVVDEIDAALDAGNVTVLSRFMRQAVSHPIIVISLKEKMYSKADYLIGVYKDLGRGGSSGLVTVDLRGFPVETDVTTTAAAMGG